MSHHYVFSVLDRKSILYAPPFCTKSVPEALRAFTGAVNKNDEKNLLRRYPGDYELVHLATIDEVSGCSVTDTALPKSFGLALDFLYAEDQK